MGELAAVATLAGDGHHVVAGIHHRTGIVADGVIGAFRQHVAQHILHGWREHNRRTSILEVAATGEAAQCDILRVDDGHHLVVQDLPLLAEGGTQLGIAHRTDGSALFSTVGCLVIVIFKAPETVIAAERSTVVVDIDVQCASHQTVI